MALRVGKHQQKQKKGNKQKYNVNLNDIYEKKPNRMALVESINGKREHDKQLQKKNKNKNSENREREKSEKNRNGFMNVSLKMHSRIITFNMNKKYLLNVNSKVNMYKSIIHLLVLAVV